MKYIILLLSLNMFSQKSYPILDPILEPYVNEFLKEAAIRNVEVFDRVIELQSISIYPITKGYGVYTGKSILIHPLTAKNEYLLRSTVYHELFHHLGLNHCHTICEHLMGGDYPFNFNYFTYKNESIWQQLINNEFKKL